MYRIAENFWGRKLSRIGENTIFAEKTFTDCSLLQHQRTPRPKFCGENFRIYSHKTTKFVKVSPSKVFRYTVPSSGSPLCRRKLSLIAWTQFTTPTECDLVTSTVSTDSFVRLLLACSALPVRGRQHSSVSHYMNMNRWSLRCLSFKRPHLQQVKPQHLTLVAWDQHSISNLVWQ